MLHALEENLYFILKTQQLTKLHGLLLTSMLCPVMLFKSVFHCQVG